MTKSKSGKIFGLRIAAVIAVVFGLLTIISGGSVLFGDETFRELAGNYLPFVVWFNFLVGFLYVLAGVGLWLCKRWSFWMAMFIVVATLVVVAALFIHIVTGGLFEMRTVFAMSLRTLIWIFIAVYAWRKILKQELEHHE